MTVGKIAESSVQRKINKPAHVGMAVTTSVSQARCVYEKCITYQQKCITQILADKLLAILFISLPYSKLTVLLIGSPRLSSSL